MINKKLQVYKNYYYALIYAIILVLVGHLVINERNLPSSDTQAYISMIKGNYDVFPSFKFRIVVPFLASFLPSEPLVSLRLITYISLVFFYFTCVMITLKMRVEFKYSVLGLFVVYSTYSNLFNFHNPFLTDAFGLLIISLMIYAFINNSFLLFTVVSLVGLFARESIIFLVPIWWIKDIRKCVLLLLFSSFIVFIPRFIFLDGGGIFDAFIGNGLVHLSQPLLSLKNIFIAFGVNWILVLISLKYIRFEKYKEFLITLLLLLVASVSTSLIAHDIIRMFSFMLPVFMVITVQLLSMLGKMNQKKWIIGIIIFSFINLFVTLPNKVFVESSYVFLSDMPRIIILLIGILLSFGIWKDLSRKHQLEGKIN